MQLAHCRTTFCTTPNTSASPLASSGQKKRTSKQPVFFSNSRKTFFPLLAKIPLDFITTNVKLFKCCTLIGRLSGKPCFARWSMPSINNRRHLKAVWDCLPRRRNSRSRALSRVRWKRGRKLFLRQQNLVRMFWDCPPPIKAQHPPNRSTRWIITTPSLSKSAAKTNFYSRNSYLSRKRAGEVESRAGWTCVENLRR